MVPGKGCLLLVVFALLALGVDLAGEHLGHGDGGRLGLGDLFLLLVALLLLLLGCSSSRGVGVLLFVVILIIVISIRCFVVLGFALSYVV